MAGPHSDWPYPTANPNKPEEEIDVEAALAYQKWRRGVPVDEVAEELGISRRTLYNRLERLRTDGGLPSRHLQRTIEFDRLEDLNRMVLARLVAGDASNQDFAKLVAEVRQIGAARRALLQLDNTPDEPEQADALDDRDAALLADWEAAEEPT